MAGIKGRIFKIKRFSVHDGPGIRTTVFLKGCPLKCIWCHSPEGISSDIAVWYNQNSCISCGRCIEACPERALIFESDTQPTIVIDRLRCKVTGDCVRVCPTGSVQFTGRITTSDEVLLEIEKDSAYYESSGGGVTLTGGEPLFQPDFTFEILRLCHEKAVHTTLETSLFASKEVVKRLAPLIDLVITDLKIFDPVAHQKFTGQSNEIIKENFAFLAVSGKDLIVRVPLVKDITDTAENRGAIQNYVQSFRSDISVEFIRFNPLAANNYKKLGIPFPLDAGK